MTIKQDIQECDYEIAAREQAILVWKRRRNELTAARSSCDHEFDPAPKGYEHEGGQCWRCGINEVYAASQKIGSTSTPVTT